MPGVPRWMPSVMTGLFSDPKIICFHPWQQQKAQQAAVQPRRARAGGARFLWGWGVRGPTGKGLPEQPLHPRPTGTSVLSLY